MKTVLTLDDFDFAEETGAELGVGWSGYRAFWSAVLQMAARDYAQNVRFFCTLDDDSLAIEAEGKLYELVPPPEDLRKPLYRALVRMAAGNWVRRLVNSLRRTISGDKKLGEIALRLPEYTIDWEVFRESDGLRVNGVASLIRHLREGNPEQHELVVPWLMDIGSAAESAVGDLVEMLKREEIAFPTTAILGCIGPNAIEAKDVLLARVTSDDLEMEGVISAWALSRIAGDDEQVAQVAIPVLTAGLSREGVHARLNSAQALAAFGPLAKEALPELRKAVHDEEELVRTVAAEAIAAIE